MFPSTVIITTSSGEEAFRGDEILVSRSEFTGLVAFLQITQNATIPATASAFLDLNESIALRDALDAYIADELRKRAS